MTAPSVASIILVALEREAIIWKAPQPNKKSNLLPWSPAANARVTVQGLEIGRVKDTHSETTKG